jgi:hypothetical protein
LSSNKSNYPSKEEQDADIKSAAKDKKASEQTEAEHVNSEQEDMDQRPQKDEDGQNEVA